MGLLDLLANQTYGDGGGLLGYLQSPLFRKPDAEAFPAPSQPLTPTEQQLMNMVRGGGQGGYVPGSGQPSPVPQDAPLTPTEQKLMALVRPGQAGQPTPQASPQPPQASPISIGNYMMPRIGAASAYEPQQGDVPPNARPTQGQMPQAPTQQPMEAPQQLPPALGGQPGGFLGQLSEGLRSIGNGGSLLGALTGNRNDPQSIAQQNMSAQFQALRQTLQQSGMSPQEAASKAMLAIMNPEAGKTIISEALTNKEKYGVVSEDPLQGKQYGFINEREQTVNGKPIGSAGAASGQPQGLQTLTDRITGLRESGATKEQLLNQIPTGYRDDVNSLITGKGVPANMGRAQSRMAILTLAKVVDPNFDETMIPTRIAMRKDFAGEGKNGQAIASFNTAQHHIDKLSDDLENLAKYNGDYPTLNSARGWLANKANTNPRLRDAMQSVNDDMAAVSHEVANAYNSGHLSDHDMATWQKLTNTDLPPDQLRRGISDFVELLNGKRDSLNHMYRQAFGSDAPTVDKEKNAAITTKVHQRLPEYARNQSSQAEAAPAITEGATATNPQTGQKLTYRGGKWQ